MQRRHCSRGCEIRGNQRDVCLYIIYIYVYVYILYISAIYTSPLGELEAPSEETSTQGGHSLTPVAALLPKCK